MKTSVCVHPLQPKTKTKTITAILISLLLLHVVVVHAEPSSGCGTKLAKGISAGGPSQNISIQSGGDDRSYLLYVPTKYEINNAAPLVLNFHGGTQDAQDQEELSQMSNSEFNENAIVAYLQSVNGYWEGDPDQPSSIDDIAFTSDLIRALSLDYCIDSTRIYATGMSDGAGFLGLLACDPILSTIITAFAPVSGAFYGQDPQQTTTTSSGWTCSPGRSPVPMLEIHGTDDSVIPYDGGARKGLVLPSVAEWLQGWAARDGVSGANVTTEEYGGGVTVSTWMEGNQVVTVGYLVDGLGHSWPSTGPNLDSSVGTYFNATPVIMDFFANWPSPSPSATASASSGSSTVSPTASATAASLGRMSYSVDLLAAVISAIMVCFATPLM